MPSPRAVVQAWAAAFNRHDTDALALLYAPDAVNWQVAEQPIEGRDAIRAGFHSFFAAFPDVGFEITSLLEDGEWAALEWEGWGTNRGRFGGHPPSGRSYRLRGCGFFQVREGQIILQRGYWDRVSWLRQIGLPY